jgi:hypothetical protein
LIRVLNSDIDSSEEFPIEVGLSAKLGPRTIKASTIQEIMAHLNNERPDELILHVRKRTDLFDYDPSMNVYINKKRADLQIGSDNESFFRGIQQVQNFYDDGVGARRL